MDRAGKIRRLGKRTSAGRVHYLVLTCLFWLLFLGVADNQATLVLLPSLGESFDVRILARGTLVTGYALGAALASLGSGVLSDQFGRKRFLQGAILAFGVFSWLTSQTTTFPQILLTRLGTGMAAGTLSTCTVAFAGDWFPYEVRGRALGIISSAYFAAPILGVPLATQLASRIGWQSVYLTFAGLGVIGLILTLQLPSENQARNPGSVPEMFRAAGHTFRMLLSRRDTVAIVSIAFLVSGGLVGFLAYISQWLEGELGLTTNMVSWVWVLGGLVGLGGAPLGGILSDRWGKKPVAVAGNGLLALALICIPWTKWGILLLTLFGLFSLASAIRQGPLTALVTELVSREHRGALVALRNISSQLGIATSTLVGGFLYERWQYPAVALFCALMTLGVVYLLATRIREPGETIQESTPRSEPST